MAALTKDERAAFLASVNQADAARVVGMAGKTFRDITRGVFGVYVQGSASHTQAGAWNDRLRAFRLAYHEAQGNAPLRAAIVASYKDTDDATPPTKVAE